MSRRKVTWLLGAALAALAVALTARFGSKTTINGLSPAEYERRERETRIDNLPGGGSQLESIPGRFKAWFPGSPFRSTRSLSGPYGTVVVDSFQLYGPRISFTASWSERAARDVRTDTERLEEVKRTIPLALGGQVVEQSDVVLGTYAGAELRLSVSTPRIGTLRTQLFVVGARLYTMEVFLMPGAELDPDVDRFFDSLIVVDDRGAELRRPSPPPPRRADVSDVYVTFTEQTAPGIFLTLLVHEDGVVELLTGIDARGPVVRRTAKGIAVVASMKPIFDSAEWRALPVRAADAGPSFTYEVTRAGRAVQRSDPISSIEPLFRKALGALGPLWIYAERTRPGQ